MYFNRVKLRFEFVFVLLVSCCGFLYSKDCSYIVPCEDYEYAMQVYTGREPNMIFPNPHPGAQWFPKAGLGLFIHWGIHSVEDLQPSWAMIKDYPFGDLPEDEDPNKYLWPNYYDLAEKFDPDAYEPDKWCEAASRAGFKYVVLTTKHHDGYALWPSRYGNMNTGVYMNGRDLVKEYAAACRKYNLKVGFYFSPRDWHFPDFPLADVGFDHNNRGKCRWSGDESIYHKNWLDFYAYTICQLRELLTQYGRIDVLWFDGLGWDRIKDRKTLQTYNWIRSLQPGIVINDRWADRKGDFATHEIKFKEEDAEVDRWWEYCFSMKGHWGYSPDRPIIGADVFCEKYRRMNELGGNVLANIGPAPDGTMPPDFYKLCEDLDRADCLEHK